MAISTMARVAIVIVPTVLALGGLKTATDCGSAIRHLTARAALAAISQQPRLAVVAISRGGAIR